MANAMMRPMRPLILVSALLAAACATPHTNTESNPLAARTTMPLIDYSYPGDVVVGTQMPDRETQDAGLVTSTTKVRGPSHTMLGQPPIDPWAGQGWVSDD